MENRNYPRVLIINDQSIYKRNATGITIRSLFKNWPVDRVVEFHTWKSSVQEREGLSLDANLIPVETFPLNLILRKVSKAEINSESSGISFGVESNDGKASVAFSIKSYIKYIAESKLINIEPIVKILSKKNFKPDVIYTMGSSFNIMHLVCKLSDYYNINICLHYMDNWRETLYKDTIPILKLNKKINNISDKIEERSNCSLVISPKMKNEYEKQYNNTYEVLMNSINVSSNDRLVEKKSSENELSFVYAGGLHLKRYESLLDIQYALSMMEVPCKLYIYTSDMNREKYEHLFDSSVTVFKNFLPHNLVYKIYEKADVLVHIESFEQKQIKYTKYSLSTKIPEYMFSGKPILCYAPRSLAVYEYINDFSAGVCVEKREELIEKIKYLASNKSARDFMGKNGRISAMKNNDIIKTQNLLLCTLKKNCKKESKERKG
ncbi:hypothetical protein [Clostridium perfringens]|nr:hypothetical protein [Clostridium perfringens]MDB2059902.1 hypothetical protein [Clostridium perfringens]MDB2065439.1 hypothetical protein [Clostridium perfringens]MDK0629694.1 hypothetical protein [Clostridium perfringens]